MSILNYSILGTIANKNITDYRGRKLPMPGNIDIDNSPD